MTFIIAYSMRGLVDWLANKISPDAEKAWLHRLLTVGCFLGLLLAGYGGGSYLWPKLKEQVEDKLLPMANELTDNPGGNAMINLAHDVTPDKRELFDVKPKHLDFNIRNARLVAPGKPDRSVLLHRMTILGPGQMPIIGRKTVDKKGVALIRRWIAAMKPN